MTQSRDLATLLSPVSEHDFLKDVLGRQVLYVRGDPSKLCTILPWAVFGENAVAQGKMAEHRVRLLKDTSELSPSLYRRMSNSCRHLDFSELLQQGAVLSVDNVDWEWKPLRDLCQNLEQRLQTCVQANAYAAWRSTADLGLRWDDHDLIMLQLAGTVSWKIFRPTMPFPIAKSRPSEPMDSDLMDIQVTSPGDCLYLPRGFWRSESFSDEGTLYVALGFRNVTGLDFIVRLLQQLADVELMRMDYPFFADLETRGKQLAFIQREIRNMCVRNLDLSWDI